ncbi:MAG: hypothetical protein HUK21_10965 [Fibrobacteraceae bacterium]|nr:hypothetical protein [Fibrobacteraceae bacterium]
MAVRTLEIECPMCKGAITVDADTGEVLSHKEYKKAVKSFDEFMASEKNKSAELEAKFAAAKEAEKNKMELLNKKFEAAKKNKDLKDPPSGILWD